MEKIIFYNGETIKIGCDEKCNKAWGVNNRPKIELDPDHIHPDYDDDIAFLSDDGLGDAPIDPGTYEGGQAKPIHKHEIPNKWCARECERCVWSDVDEPLKFKDFSKILYNQPFKHPELS